jgi:hypothetical protein
MEYTPSDSAGADSIAMIISWSVGDPDASTQETEDLLSGS